MGNHESTQIQDSPVLNINPLRLSQPYELHSCHYHHNRRPLPSTLVPSPCDIDQHLSSSYSNLSYHPLASAGLAWYASFGLHVRFSCVDHNISTSRYQNFLAFFLLPTTSIYHVMPKSQFSIKMMSIQALVRCHGEQARRTWPPELSWSIRRRNSLAITCIDGIMGFVVIVCDGNYSNRYKSQPPVLHHRSDSFVPETSIILL